MPLHPTWRPADTDGGVLGLVRGLATLALAAVAGLLLLPLAWAMAEWGALRDRAGRR